MGQILLPLNWLRPWSYRLNSAFGPDGVLLTEFSHWSKNQQVMSENLHEVIDWLIPSHRVFIYSVLLVNNPGIIDIWCIAWHPWMPCTLAVYWLISVLGKNGGGLILAESCISVPFALMFKIWQAKTWKVLLSVDLWP